MSFLTTLGEETRWACVTAPKPTAGGRAELVESACLIVSFNLCFNGVISVAIGVVSDD